MNPYVPSGRTSARSCPTSRCCRRGSRRARGAARRGAAATHAASDDRVRLTTRHETAAAGSTGCADSTHVRCQSSSMTRHQSRWPWSTRPETCSSRSRFTAAGRIWPRCRARASSRSVAPRAAAARSGTRRRSARRSLSCPASPTSGGRSCGEGAPQRRLAAPAESWSRVGQRQRRARARAGRGAASGARASAPSRRCPP